MTKNNLSRVIFRDFLEMNGLEKEHGSRNVFHKDGKKYAFSVINNGPIECRQFYNDCDGLVCYDYKKDNIYEVDKENLIISSSPNRISPSGLKAYNARCSFEKAKKSSFVV